MKSRFGKNIAQAGLYTYLSAIFRFFTTLILARLLVPEEFGLIAMIQVFSGLILILRDAGFSVAVIRGNVGLSEEELHVASLSSGVIFSLLMFGLSFYLPAFYNVEEIRAPGQLLALVFIFSSLTTVPQALARRDFDFQKLGRYGLLSELISSSACILAALGDLSYWSLVIRELLFYLMMSFLFRNSVGLLGIRSIIDIRAKISVFVKLASQYGSIQLLEYGARNIDNLLIGKLQGERDLGLYSRTYSLIYICHTFLLGIVNNVMFPTLEAEGKAAMRKFLMTFLGLSFLAGVVNLILMLFPNKIVIILWGSNWVDLIPFVPYIGIAIFIQIPFGMFANIFMANHKDSILLKLTAAKFLIIGVSISIGAVNGIESLLQWYNGGFILYGILLLKTLKKSLQFNYKDILVYWMGILVALAYLIHQLFSLPIYFLIFLWASHTIYMGIILLNNYRSLKSID